MYNLNFVITNDIYVFSVLIVYRWILNFYLYNIVVFLAGMSVLDSAMPQYRLLISTMEGLFVEIKISIENDGEHFIFM